jgi:hypothetical protein
MRRFRLARDGAAAAPATTDRLATLVCQRVDAHFMLVSVNIHLTSLLSKSFGGDGTLSTTVAGHHHGLPYDVLPKKSSIRNI